MIRKQVDSILDYWDKVSHPSRAPWVTLQKRPAPVRVPGTSGVRGRCHPYHFNDGTCVCICWVCLKLSQAAFLTS